MTRLAQHRGLAAALWISVVYDLVAFGLLMWMPGWLLDLFSHPMPDSPFLFRLAGLPLLLLPVVYAMAATDPLERWDLTVASFRLRVLGGLSIAAVVLWQRPVAPGAYWTFAIADAVWAAIYAIAARRAGRDLLFS